jgi:hypothetical protein
MNIIAFGLILWCAQSALSHIPSVDFIIGEMAKRCGPAPSRDVLLNSVITKKNGSKEQRSFVPLMLKHDGLHVLASKSLGALVKNARIDLFVLSKLFNCPQGKSAMCLKAYLIKAAVNTEVISLGFFDYEPVYIIGAIPTDLSSPQLWVEMASFLPVKEIEKSRVTTFEKWRSVNSLSSKKFPHIITTSVRDSSERIAISENMMPNLIPDLLDFDPF